MATAGDLVVNLIADNRRLSQGLNQSRGMLTSFAQSAKSLVAQFAGAFAIGTVIKESVAASAELEETLNKFNVVFDQNATAVQEWGNTFAAEIGRSQSQILSFLAGSQDLFVPLGFDASAATEMSKQITQLAIDLASFNNMTDTDVLRDLHAALTGSGEVMKKYGVIVSEATVKQEAFNMGLNPKELTDQEKVLARLNIIMRGTTAAQGDAERSAGSLTNQWKAFKANLTDGAAALGDLVTPALAIGLRGLNEFTSGVKEAKDEFSEFVNGFVEGSYRLVFGADSIRDLPAFRGELVPGSIGAVEDLQRAAEVLSQISGGAGAVIIPEGFERIEAAVTGLRALQDESESTVSKVDSLRSAYESLTATLAASNLSDARRGQLETAQQFVLEQLNDATGITKRMESLRDELRKLNGDSAAQIEVDKFLEAGATTEKASELLGWLEDVEAAKARIAEGKEHETLLANMRREAEAIRDSLRAPEEVFRAESERIAELRAAGLLTEQQAIAAITQESKKLAEDLNRDVTRAGAQSPTQASRFGERQFIERIVASTFGPDRNVTERQIAANTKRAADLAQEQVNLLRFQKPGQTIELVAAGRP